MNSYFKRLFAPWRLEYVMANKPKSNECLFCDKIKEKKDRENGIIAYSTTCYVLLNRYPYVNGHIMVAPSRHIKEVWSLTADESDDFFKTVKIAARALEDAYHPSGMNIGMNIGEAAGAGVAGHLHCHLIPRWVGDTSFISVISDVRMIMETLEMTYDKLRPLFLSSGLSEKRNC
ncbi:MAG: HIT domain-containing protein [Myxococcota bacterium]